MIKEVTVIVRRPYTAYVEVPEGATDAEIAQKVSEEVEKHGAAMLYDEGYVDVEPQDIEYVYPID